MRMGPWCRYPYSCAARPRSSAIAGAPSTSVRTTNRSDASSSPPTYTGTCPSGTPACAFFFLPLSPRRMLDDGDDDDEAQSPTRESRRISCLIVDRPPDL
ncbi:hypothetical protein HU200_060945 [Digitaria exilis]|uniref:Uncharacterized protein n=1 Tax=Digitaria exilis TaxID=1010633 RepID=A0A835A5Q6_9POAL|nr:hypothetical protein HU200_060945 [Digitaria exilis]